MATSPFVLNNGNSSKRNNLFNRLSNNTLEGVRVTNIILDDSTSEGWAALGAIEYQSINSSFTSKAYPLNPNVKFFPLINEIVYLISLPSSDMNISNTRKKIYYINNVGIWNHPHHNAFPIDNTTPSTRINLGETFQERSNIHPLLPFEGDFIQEGRWGNSLRFGSTVQERDNNWSIYGTNGDPITILRNGQGEQIGDGWTPIVEDVNNDNSSIYLTSTQNIPLDVSSDKYDSYLKNEPKNPNQYNGAQILLNSGRLVFNSNQDHILLSSAKSINLNGKESVNIDTLDCIVSATKIYLGGYEAIEPLMLGNRTINFLKSLISTVETLNKALTGLTSPPIVITGVATFPTLNIATAKVNTALEDLKSKLNKETLTSERNFTI